MPSALGDAAYGNITSSHPRISESHRKFERQREREREGGREREREGGREKRERKREGEIERERGREREGGREREERERRNRCMYSESPSASRWHIVCERFSPSPHYSPDSLPLSNVATIGSSNSRRGVG